MSVRYLVVQRRGDKFLQQRTEYPGKRRTEKVLGRFIISVTLDTSKPDYVGDLRAWQTKLEGRYQARLQHVHEAAANASPGHVKYFFYIPARAAESAREFGRHKVE